MTKHPTGTRNEFIMRKVHTITVMVGLLLSLIVSAQKPTREGTNKIEPLPRDWDIQLALSSLPPHLRDKATVYVLNPDKGFEVARKGTNGFHALRCSNWGRHHEGVLALYGISRRHSLPNFL
jgi:hypothetical protein